MLFGIGVIVQGTDSVPLIICNYEILNNREILYTALPITKSGRLKTQRHSKAPVIVKRRESEVSPLTTPFPSDVERRIYIQLMLFQSQNNSNKKHKT